ncbi:MAG: DUF6644 family protein [Acidobacteriota bacterium]
MDFQAFMQSLQDMSLATTIRESALTYPIVLATHLTGMGLFGGMIVMTDLRILGVAMKQRTMAEVHNQLRPYKHLGLTLVVTCGLLLAWSKAAVYWPNPYFKMKLSLLALVALHALVFRGPVYKNLGQMDKFGKATGMAKLAAVISLLLWINLVAAGRWIGYWEAPTSF